MDFCNNCKGTKRICDQGQWVPCPDCNVEPYQPVEVPPQPEAMDIAKEDDGGEGEG